MTTKKAAVKTTKPKTPAKPKFGEVGYEFNVKATITEVNSEDDEYKYPFTIQLQLGDFEDYDNEGRGYFAFHYPDKKSFTEAVGKSVPSLLKTLKTEELTKAKAEVARLEKELAALK